ncbi:unnamed protein product, partial [Meganyctiphanes norvegica]
MAGRNGALSLLKNYGSDSEGDSGYTSEEEKKRKNEYRSPHEHRKKRRKADEEEDMMVDSPPSASLPRRRKHQCLQKKGAGEDDDYKDMFAVEELLKASRKNSSNRQSLIPLPSELLEDRNSHIDDPSQHQGRVRSIAHERGNWASFIFIPLHLGVYEASFSSFLASLAAVCQDQDLTLQTSTDLHISLSRTLILYLHWIQPLKDYFNQRLRLVPKFLQLEKIPTLYLNYE